MSIFDDVFCDDNLTSEEKMQRFLEIVSRIGGLPEWEGRSVPNLPKIRNYLRAAEILKELFQNSDEVEIQNEGLQPYHDSSGGVVYLWSGKDHSIASAVFEKRKAILLISDFFSLIDSITVTAERSLNDDHPGFVITISWVVFDTMIGDWEE